MNCRIFSRLYCLLALVFALNAGAVPVIDPINDVNALINKALVIPITATSSAGWPLTYTVTSSTNAIGLTIRTNRQFLKVSVAQATDTPVAGSYLFPFRGTNLVLVTNLGDMTFMLFQDRAPKSVEILRGLVQSGFYNSNTIFHRVIKDFVIQGGDPNTNGTGGPAFRYDDEFNGGAIFTGNGQLALANSGRDTDGSQFFVTIGPQRNLDFGYTIWGQMVRGFQVLTNIENTPTNTASRPLKDVIITQAGIVPDPFDTVLTLVGAIATNITGAISVVADDGHGGRATNTFQATTVADTIDDQPFLSPVPVANRITPVNTSLTNVVGASDLDGAIFGYALALDTNAPVHATNTTINSGSGRLIFVPDPGYTGPVNLHVGIAEVLFYKYDTQLITFAVGDSPITAFASNFTASATLPFTNQLVAVFTNAIPNSPATNFVATVNWGDNTITTNLIATNSNGMLEVRGSHTYGGAGDFPIIVHIISNLGADATVYLQAIISPPLSVLQAGGNALIKWPAWAMDYQLQSSTNLAGADWTPVTTPSSLIGYELVITNPVPAVGNVFFRLMK